MGIPQELSCSDDDSSKENLVFDNDTNTYNLNRLTSEGDVSSRISRFKLDESIRDSLACEPN